MDEALCHCLCDDCEILSSSMFVVGIVLALILVVVDMCCYCLFHCLAMQCAMTTKLENFRRRYLFFNVEMLK